MELRHLRYFIAVAEEKHITRAAERLGMQQPPLSQQIKAIERELDVQLFLRKARGVELTDAGRAFLEEARATLMHLDRAFDSTRRASRGEQGRLCVGVTSTTPFHPVVPRAIRAFREACPMVALTLEECLSNESVDRVRNEQMDVAFVRAAMGNGQGLAVTSLLDEPMVVALPSSHVLAQTKTEAPVSLDRLSRETFILYGPPGTGMYDSTIAACRAAGFSPRIGNLGASTQLAPRITSTLSLVGAGLGITFVPASLQRMNMEGVIYRSIKGSNRPMATLKLASRRDDKSAVVKQFINFVRKEAKDYAVGT
ncbi:DNA-binding transcriptional regulator, LysR family [Bradyrhizobium sp. Rc3b]|uniref:LysR family transcriptional regulator n=1 Tax=Bradyrhizobium sp. Rc3b TaxID=1855322 RepID=UPI0008F4100F|nr:LysR family transcriptional regulator [Bradyrhizobium sp. Rc3b]SFN23848.1 DNA-binding transcriptional regulator, LysR family [Bradyrhizobium sp. Rc3b]